MNTLTIGAGVILLAVSVVYLAAIFVPLFRSSAPPRPPPPRFYYGDGPRRVQVLPIPQAVIQECPTCGAAWIGSEGKIVNCCVTFTLKRPSDRGPGPL